MLFNTPIFLLFLIVTVTIFYFLPKKIDKIFFLAASYVFYAYWDWRFLFLLIASTVLDYYFGLFIYRSKTKKGKDLILFLSVFVNLAILVFFKYFNFFIDSFNVVFGGKLSYIPLHILLPVGLSFYTFQSLSYTIDIYREKLEPTKSLLDYCLFVGIFPHMVAGPIVRARDILPQLAILEKPKRDEFKAGISLITVGLFQKVLIGDTAARFVDPIFSDPKFYSSNELLFSMLMFSIQIYGDFAGYSNIARGSAKFFGLDLIDNFNQPYYSKSITEFWRRWHISLSTWFYDYLFNPLAMAIGNLGNLGIPLALLTTFFLSGLWHGAGFKFIVFGLIHGVAIVYEFFTKKIRKRIFKLMPLWLNNLLSQIITFSYVTFALLFFRSANMATAKFYLRRIFTDRVVDTVQSNLSFDLLVIFLAYFVTILVIDQIEIRRKKHEFLVDVKAPIRLGIIIPVLAAVILYMYTIGKAMPFIYFQF